MCFLTLVNVIYFLSITFTDSNSSDISTLVGDKGNSDFFRYVFQGLPGRDGRDGRDGKGKTIVERI